jgi:hypothetical protein
MALVGVLSTQLLHALFVVRPLDQGAAEPSRIIERTEEAA